MSQEKCLAQMNERIIFEFENGKFKYFCLTFGFKEHITSKTSHSKP